MGHHPVPRKAARSNPRAKKSNVQFDVDEAKYVGSEDDGVYYQVAKGPRGWYMTAVVDCDTAHFVDTLVSDDGPYKTAADAMQAGEDAACEWCYDNSVVFELERGLRGARKNPSHSHKLKQVVAAVLKGTHRVAIEPYEYDQAGYTAATTAEILDGFIYVFPVTIETKSIAGPRPVPGWRVERDVGEGDMELLSEHTNYAGACAAAVAEVAGQRAHDWVNNEGYAEDIRETQEMTSAPSFKRSLHSRE